MPSPFPGMDPYLELARAWSGVHFALISSLQDVLGPLLRPKYTVRGEERVYLSGDDDPGHSERQPDLHVYDVPGASGRRWQATASPSRRTATVAPIVVPEPDEEEIHEHYLEIRSVLDRSVVAVIEVLSPSNKVYGSKGRAAFLEERRMVTATDAHWLELDLLRGGYRTTYTRVARGSAYQVYLSRAGEPRQRLVWPVALRDRLPVIAVPLRTGDPEVPLDLQAVFDRAYDRGGYDLDFDYVTDPVPTLAAEDLAWATALSADRR